MVRRLSTVTALFVVLAAGGSTRCSAQAGLTPGARAGNAIVPSTHTPGCGGILCDADDPRRQPGAPPPPPCQGLICGLSPYGMAPPVTAAEAQRLQQDRARAEAAAAATPVTPIKHARRRVVKAHKAATVAARTPDPAATAAPAAK